MKTPKILHKALRQYQHNDCSGMITGFDYEETVKIIHLMEGKMKTPKILHKALRQYGMITGFDYEETVKIINLMEKALNAQAKLIKAYHGGQSLNDFDNISDKTEVKGEKNENT